MISKLVQLVSVLIVLVVNSAFAAPEVKIAGIQSYHPSKFPDLI